MKNTFCILVFLSGNKRSISFNMGKMNVCSKTGLVAACSREHSVLLKDKTLTAVRNLRKKLFENGHSHYDNFSLRVSFACMINLMCK